MVSKMTKTNTQTKTERGIILRIFTESHKSQSWINLITFSILSFFLLFFLLVALESAFDDWDFFKNESYEFWLIYILIPISIVTIVFIISYKFEKIRLKLFKFSIAGLLGLGLGFGLYAILDTTTNVLTQFGTLIGFFITLAFSLILGTISLLFPLKTKND